MGKAIRVLVNCGVYDGWVISAAARVQFAALRAEDRAMEMLAAGFLADGASAIVLLGLATKWKLGIAGAVLLFAAIVLIYAKMKSVAIPSGPSDEDPEVIVRRSLQKEGPPRFNG